MLDTSIFLHGLSPDAFCYGHNIIGLFSEGLLNSYKILKKCIIQFQAFLIEKFIS